MNKLSDLNHSLYGSSKAFQHLHSPFNSFMSSFYSGTQNCPQHWRVPGLQLSALNVEEQSILLAPHVFEQRNAGTVNITCHPSQILGKGNDCLMSCLSQHKVLPLHIEIKAQYQSLQNHRIVRIGKGPLEIIQSYLLPGQGHPDQGTQERVQYYAYRKEEQKPVGIIQGTWDSDGEKSPTQEYHWIRLWIIYRNWAILNISFVGIILLLVYT
ncbi:hypothetical protein HGM15179_001072 [Zosterops borbonicus]|uniref:Uncharacterized protein n=1 Tax=Zosterops borbonicus TaxID=364589 RepID=A0A8K1GV29_9PASS|nr:hypothetical protein HGM15179_001072 [Zosterops borbonicus]